MSILTDTLKTALEQAQNTDAALELQTYRRAAADARVQELIAELGKLRAVATADQRVERLTAQLRGAASYNDKVVAERDELKQVIMRKAADIDQLAAALTARSRELEDLRYHLRALKTFTGETK